MRQSLPSQAGGGLGGLLHRAALGALLVLLSALLLGVTARRARASVDLLYFIAQPEPTRIVLYWETASELDNAGFFVTRREDPQADFTRLSALIPATSEGVNGARYNYPDAAVTAGHTYYYMLEIIDTSGGSEFSEPITVTLQTTSTATSTATPTGTGTAQTATPTATASLTPTVTATGNTATPTRTATRTASATSRTSTPTRTRTPFFIPPTATRRLTSTITRTPTSSATLTPTITQTPTRTPTFLPLPRLTLLFPVLSPTATATNTPTLTPSRTPRPAPAGRTAEGPPLRLLGGLIVLLWVALAGFLVVYIRRLGY